MSLVPAVDGKVRRMMDDWRNLSNTGVVDPYQIEDLFRRYAHQIVRAAFDHFHTQADLHVSRHLNVVRADIKDEITRQVEESSLCVLKPIARPPPPPRQRSYSLAPSRSSRNNNIRSSSIVPARYQPVYPRDDVDDIKPSRIVPANVTTATTTSASSSNKRTTSDNNNSTNNGKRQRSYEPVLPSSPPPPPPQDNDNSSNDALNGGDNGNSGVYDDLAPL